MRQAIVKALAGVVVAGMTGTALGGIIDLRDLPGNFDQFTWGQPDTTIYAQSLVSDVNGIFDEFRFRAASTSGTDIIYSLLITGTRADGGGGLGLSPDMTDIRFDSGLMTIPGSGELIEAVFNPNIGVLNGETVFAVLNTWSYPNSGQGFVRATQFNGEDQYVPGEFVFINTGGLGIGSLEELNNFNWSHRFDNGEDLAIFASFVTPSPGALALIAVGGLIGTRRRRR